MLSANIASDVSSVRSAISQGWKRDGILQNIKSELRPDTIGFQECDSPELLTGRTGLEVASKFAGAQGQATNSSGSSLG